MSITQIKIGAIVLLAISACIWIGWIIAGKIDRAQANEARSTLTRAMLCDFRQYEQVERFLACVQELQRYPTSVVCDQLTSIEASLIFEDRFGKLDKLYFVNRVFYDVPEDEQGPWRVEVLPRFVSLGGGGTRFGIFDSPSEEFASMHRKYDLRDVQDLIDRGKESE